MADAVAGWGFTDLKLERRRPSKRQTTKRPFVIVKNWQSSTDSATTSSLATPVKEIAPSSCSQEIAPSPQFPKQQWKSKQNKDNNEKIIDDNAFQDGLQSVEVDPSQSTADDRTECPVVDGTDSTIDLKVPSPAIDGVNQSNTSHVISDQPSNSGSKDSKDSVECESISVSAKVMVTPSHNKDISDVSLLREHSKGRRRQQPSEKSHKEAQSARKTRGRKRKQDNGLHDDFSEDVYNENRFVRIFNADQGRKVSVSEITDLDVVLTAIEEEALQYRDEVESETEKQSIKEFFIQTRKSFGNCIDLQKELKGMKSDLRKAKSRLNKCRSELFEVQKKRTRIKGRLVKLQKEKSDQSVNNQDLPEINNFVEQMKSIQRRCPLRTASSKQTMSNLPSVMCQMQALLVSMIQLQAVNTTFEDWLNTSEQRAR